MDFQSQSPILLLLKFHHFFTLFKTHCSKKIAYEIQYITIQCNSVFVLRSEWAFVFQFSFLNPTFAWKLNFYFLTWIFSFFLRERTPTTTSRIITSKSPPPPTTIQRYFVGEHFLILCRYMWEISYPLTRISSKQKKASWWCSSTRWTIMTLRTEFWIS